MTGAAKITERGTDGVAFEANTPASQPGDIFPAGAILLWGATAAPIGWFICDGSAISRAGYPDLFMAYGTTWGAGDGSTTFNIPDFRDRVPVGKSGTKALASSGGAETHAITIAEMPSHNHGGATGNQSANHTHVWDYVSNIFAAPGTDGVVSAEVWGTAGDDVYMRHPSGVTSTESVNHTHAVSSQGSGTAMSLMQPYKAINYIVRAY